jgi:hypothetical protein
MGDPACFLSSTCITCGRMLEPGAADADRCPHCGAPLDHLDREQAPNGLARVGPSWVDPKAHEAADDGDTGYDHGALVPDE